jgi:Fe-S cluster assembly scaffold protein SufB
VSSEYATRYGYKTYTFLDSKGYVYLTHSTNKHTDTVEQDIRETLQHYGYTLPKKYTLKGGTEVELESNSWRTVYGDFTSSPVVLVTYKEYYGNHIDTLQWHL